MARFTYADWPASVRRAVWSEAPDGAAPLPFLFTGTSEHPEVDFDAGRPHDDQLLNDRRTGLFGALAESGRIVRLRLYGSLRPEGLCTVEVTGESPGGARRTVALELGAIGLPAVPAAIQAGPSANSQEGHVRVLAHWGEIYDNRDMVPEHQPGPWPYQKLKNLAKRFGSYYVPDREGRLYRNGTMDPASAQTPLEVFGSLRAGDDKGLVFVDTVDQAPPASDNLATLVVDAPYMEGFFYLAAHVVLSPEGRGQAVPAWSPPASGPETSAGRVSVTLEDATIQGVVHVAGRLSVQHPIRVFGAVVAEGGLNGDGLLEVWFNDDLRQGLFHGLPAVFPIRGTWREWGGY
jgi:hypothetical protein